MLSRQYIRENTDELREALRLRRMDEIDLDSVLEIDES